MYPDSILDWNHLVAATHRSEITRTTEIIITTTAEKGLKSWRVGPSQVEHDLTQLASSHSKPSLHPSPRLLNQNIEIKGRTGALELGAVLVWTEETVGNAVAQLGHVVELKDVDRLVHLAAKVTVLEVQEENFGPCTRWGWSRWQGAACSAVGLVSRLCICCRLLMLACARSLRRWWDGEVRAELERCRRRRRWCRHRQSGAGRSSCTVRRSSGSGPLAATGTRSGTSAIALTLPSKIGR